MSKTIDQKVVEMNFDNARFEKNVATSMSTLDKLKAKLSGLGSSKSLENLGAASKKVDIGPLSNALDTVRLKFSALDVAGVTALANITNQAVNAGKRMVKALTIDPVKQGFNEYELKMNSVQTIMASTGESLSTVNRQLEELNEYADQTIYSFSDMTSNIGKFTNAGVKLEDAVMAIKGISNEAAISGANATQASHAMYNFSQALSSGYVKLIDWKSIENANMATKEFKTQLLESAVAAGTLTRAGDGLYKSGKLTISATKDFNDSLKNEWMTTEVLVNTLKKYADVNSDIGKKAYEAATSVKTFTQLFDTLKESAGSGWAQTWELIFGDFEEAKSFFTYLSKTIGGFIDNSAKSRNKLLGDTLNSKWDTVKKQITDAGVSVEDFQKTMSATAKSHNMSLDDMIKEYKTFDGVMKSGKISSALVVETLEKLAGGTKKVSGSTEDMNKKLAYFQKVVNDVWKGNYKNGAERVEALTKAGYKYKEVQDLVNKTVNGHKLTIDDLSNAQLKNVGYTDQEIKKIRELADEAKKAGTPLNELINNLSKPSGRDLLLGSFKNMLTAIIKPMKAIKDAWNDIFSPNSSNRLYYIIEAFHKFTEKLIISDNTANNLKRTFKGLFASLQVAGTIVSKTVGAALQLIGTLLGKTNVHITDITAAIGDQLVKFRDWALAGNKLTETFSKFLSVGKKVLDLIKESIKKFLELPKVNSAVESVRKAFDGLATSVKDKFKGCTDAIGKFVDDISKLDEVTLEGVSKAFSDFKDNVENNFSNMDIDIGIKKVNASFEKFKIGTKGSLSDTNKSVEGTQNVLSKFGEFIKSKLPTMISLGLSVGVITAAKKLANALNTLAGPVGAITNVLNGFNTAMKRISKGVKGVLRSIQFEVVARGIKELSKAIFILAGALALIAIVTSSEKFNSKNLWSAVRALGVLILLLTGLTAAVAAVEKFGDFKSASLVLVSLSASLILVASALAIMESLDYTTARKNVALLGTIAVGLAIIAGVLSKKVPEMSRGTITIIAIALSLKVMASALKDLNDANIQNIAKPLLAMIGLMIGLGIVAGKCRGAQKGLFGVIGIALSLKILLSVLKDAAAVDLATVIKSLGSLGAIIFTMRILLVASGFAGKYALQGGIGILAMTAAMHLLINLMHKFEDLDQGTIDKAKQVIPKIMLLFGAVIAMSYFAGKHAAKAGIMLIAMSGAMIILTYVIKLMEDIEPDKLSNAVKAISVLGLVFGALIALTHFAQDVKGTLITLIVAVALLSALLIAFTFIKEDELKAATRALTAVVGVFSLLVFVCKFVSKEKGVLSKTVGELMLLVLVTGCLAAIVVALSFIPNPENAIKSAEALSLLLLTFASALNIISHSGSFNKGRLLDVEECMAVLLGIVAGLALVLGLLSSLGTNPEALIPSTEALSVLLLSLSASCVILSAIPRVSKNALGAMGILTAVVAGLALVLGLLASFCTNIDALIPASKSLSLLLLSMSASLGILTLVGLGGPAALIGVGCLAVLIAAMAGIMIGLGALVTYVPEVETFINKGLPLLGKLGEGLGAFVGGIVAGFTNEVLTIIPNIGTALSDFMTNLDPFVEKASALGQNKDVLEGVKTLAETMLIIAGTSFITSITNFLSGGFQFEKFGAKLSSLGVAMVTFSKIVDGNINEEAITAAANAGKKFAEIAATIPATGGFKQVFSGNQDLDTFGKNLIVFGGYMVSFSKIVSKEGAINSTAIQAASDAAGIMVALNNTIPQTGGLIEFFKGHTNLATFGNNLVSFGRSLTWFSYEVSGKNAINSTAIQAAADAGAIMVALNNTIPQTGGLISFFTGHTDLGYFGDQLSEFGKGICKFSKAVSEEGAINVQAINTAAVAAGEMIKLAEIIPKTGGMKSWWEGNNSLSDFGEKMEDFAKSMSKFSKTVSSKGAVNGKAIADFERSCRIIMDLANELSTVNFDGITGLSKSLSSLGTNAAKSFVKAFNTAGTDALNAAKKFIGQFVKGLDSSKSDITKSISDIVKKIKDKYSDFEKAGSYLVDGFVAGINNNKYKATRAGKDLAAAAIYAAEKRLDENSPSKVFYGIGDFAGVAFVNALYSYADKAGKAGSAIADSSIIGISNTIANISKILDSDIDVQPTIRPVMDLSDVRAGAGFINSMFDMAPSVGVRSNINAISSMMGNRQNASNWDVISAIKDLKNTMSEKSGDTYQFGDFTYDDGSNVQEAVGTLIRAVKVERRK